MLMDTEYNHSFTVVKNFGFLPNYRPGCINPHMRYGERLKTAREHAKLTQKQLAERIGDACTQENISKLERSLTTKGSEYTVQFAEACGVRPMWLASEQGDMVDGYVVEDQRLVHLVKVCEALPDYAVDQLVQQGDAMAKLVAEGGKH